MRFKKIGVLIPALILSGCSGGFGNNNIEKPAVVDVEELPEYNVEQVRLTNMQSSTQIYFSYRQAEESEYSFDRSGKLGKVYFKSGDVVANGDIIATLDGYEAAKEEYTNSTAELEKYQSKYDDLAANVDYQLREYEIKHKYGYMSDADYELNTKTVHSQYDDTLMEYEDKISLLELKISEAEKIIDNGAIIANASGVVSQIRNVYKSGKNDNGWDWFWGDNQSKDEDVNYEELYNHVEPGDVIAKIANNGDPVFVCETEYASKFNVGDSLKLESGEKVYETYVSQVTDDTVVLSPLRAYDSLHVGNQIAYKLVLEEKTNVMVVSQSSIHVSGDNYYVYIVGDDNLRQMRKIEVGISNSQEVEILSGLELGDVVVKR